MAISRAPQQIPILYSTRDVARRAQAAGLTCDIGRASDTIRRHNIGEMLGGRRVLTGEQVQKVLTLLADARPGNPEFGIKWTGKTAKKVRKKS